MLSFIDIPWQSFLLGFCIAFFLTLYFLFRMKRKDITIKVLTEKLTEMTAEAKKYLAQANENLSKYNNLMQAHLKLETDYNDCLVQTRSQNETIIMLQQKEHELVVKLQNMYGQYLQAKLHSDPTHPDWERPANVEAGGLFKDCQGWKIMYGTNIGYIAGFTADNICIIGVYYFIPDPYKPKSTDTVSRREFVNYVLIYPEDVKVV